jgi:hypothetical protein
MHGGGQGIEGDCKEMAKAGMEEWAKEVFDQALKVAEGIGHGGGQRHCSDCGRDGKAGMDCLTKP